MTIEAEINALIAEAEPLRCLPDDEAERLGLPKLVERINALRAQQAKAAMSGEGFQVADVMDLKDEFFGEELEQRVELLVDSKPRRKPGRPPKAAVEGADAE